MLFFFFQAEDGIRDRLVTGVQTCALPIYHLDMHSRDALYVLPRETDARNFSAGRFDAAMELSPHIADMFTHVKNVGHKRARAANLYIRGGQSDEIGRASCRERV